MKFTEVEGVFKHQKKCLTHSEGFFFMKPTHFLIGTIIFAVTVLAQSMGQCSLIPYSGSSVVVNVDARFDGETGAPHLTGVILPAGTFRFELVGPKEDSRAIFVAWSPFNFLNVWLSTFALSAPSQGFFTLLGDEVLRGSPQQAFDDTGDRSLDVFFPVPTTVLSFVRDNLITDNRGGVSFEVTQLSAVPEPRAYGMIIILLGVCATLYHRHRSRSKPELS